MRYSSLGSCVALSAVLLTFAASAAGGQVTNAGIAAFVSVPVQVNFTGIADGTEMNGFTSGGVQFNYSLGNGHIIADGGPGVTNNVNPINLVSVGNNTGVLTLILPGLSNIFGFGYSVLSGNNITNATNVTVFNGATNLGNLFYNAVPDPTFSGGFAGLQSVMAFDRVQVTFNSVESSAFALDNIRFASVSVVPEPSSLLLLGAGLGGIVLVGRRRRSRHV